METNHASTQSVSPVLSAAQASRRGLYRLTSSYQPAERWMLQRVLTDLARSHIPTALVAEDGGHSIYRAKRHRSLPCAFDI